MKKAIKKYKRTIREKNQNTPRELLGVVIDTSRYKVKKSSTEILKELRYGLQNNEALHC